MVSVRVLVFLLICTMCVVSNVQIVYASGENQDSGSKEIKKTTDALSKLRYNLIILFEKLFLIIIILIFVVLTKIFIKKLWITRNQVQ